MEDLLEKQAKSNHDTVPNDCHELKEIFKIVCWLTTASVLQEACLSNKLLQEQI